MIRYFILLIMLLQGSSMVAQETNAEETDISGTPKFSIKNGTSSLLNPVLPSVNIGIEKYFGDRFSVYLEGGPTLKVRYFTAEPQFNSLSGYRLKGALRYFLEPARMGEVFYYVELMGTYFHIDANIAGDFRRTTSFGSFNQRIDYDMDRNRTGIYLNFGFQSVDVSGFLLEMGIGGGALRRNDQFSDIPSDATFRTNGSSLGFFDYNNFEGAREWMATVFFYVNLGFAVD